MKQLALFALIANTIVKQHTIAGEILLKNFLIFFINNHSLKRFYHIKIIIVDFRKNNKDFGENDEKQQFLPELLL